MEHWGFTDEVREAAKHRRRSEDKEAVKEDSESEEEFQRDKLNDDNCQ
jgi:hypothetical protein